MRWPDASRICALLVVAAAALVVPCAAKRKVRGMLVVPIPSLIRHPHHGTVIDSVHLTQTTI